MNRLLVLFVYNLISLPIFILVYPFIGFFNPKFKQAQTIRKQLIFDVLLLRSKMKKGEKLVWIHSASMGEFEQARPLISALKKENPDTKIVSTFMSPSGYEHRKNYLEVDLTQYIPLDFYWSVSQFYSALKPDIGIIIRYEFWPNLILSASRFKTPLYLICASLKQDSTYGKIYAKWFFKPIFLAYQKILTVNENHTKRFELIIPEHRGIETVGDTRFDQVILRSKQVSEEIKLMRDESKITFIIGSSWKEDEQILFPAFTKLKKEFPNLRMIIVPHEIHKEKVSELKSRFSDLSIVSFSAMENNSFDILLVDVMGKLLQLYYTADFAYVGGGFGAGIHNILEAGVFGFPIAYGPNFQRSPEGVEMVDQKLSTIIKTQQEAEDWMTEIVRDKNKRIESGNKIKEYIFRYDGVTEKIITAIGFK